MRTPWLSVIVPTFNGERFLAEALESVVRQADSSLEVIAVDDGSSDRTVSILESFASRLDLTILRGSHHGSWIRSSNRALEAARGEYACFLHQDDFWHDGRISAMRALGREFPQAVLLLHQADFVDAAGRKVGRWRCPFRSKKALLSSELVLSRLIVQNFIAVPAPIWKREAAGPLDERLWFTGDWKMWLKLAQVGPWAYLPQPLSGFRLHAGSQTITGVKNGSSYGDQYASVLNEFLPAVAPNRRLESLARFSCDTNQCLASHFHRRRSPWLRLLIDGMKLGPMGWFRFAYYSRIFERVAARLRVKLRLS